MYAAHRKPGDFYRSSTGTSATDNASHVEHDDRATRIGMFVSMSEDDKRQALSFLKTLVENFDDTNWPSNDDGSVTYAESFRTVTVSRVGDEAFAEVSTNTGTKVRLSGSDHKLVRDLAEAVGVTAAGDGA